ncbi:hypothetical protein CWN57_29845, partial [Klebsiella pneumoniae]
YSISYYINTLLSPEGIMLTLLSCSFYSFIYLIFAFVFVLSNLEKKIILSAVISKYNAFSMKK